MHIDKYPHSLIGNMDEMLEKVMLEKLGFENSLLAFDAFPAYKTDEIQGGKLIEKKTNILMIPPGCTSKYQSMDVCVNKLFKDILPTFWVE